MSAVNPDVTAPAGATPRDNAPVNAKAAARAKALDARLQVTELPEGGWDAALRGAARDRLAQMGLPARRDEYWLFTRPEGLVEPDVAPLPDLLDVTTPFDGMDALTLVFVDGVFDATASDDLSLEGVEISRLGEGAPWAAEIYGVLEAEAHDPVPRPLAALATAAARDGVLIRVTGKAARPIHIRHERRNPSADVFWHHIVRLEKGAEATLFESGASGGRWTGLIEADLGDDAALHHIAAFAAEAGRVSASHLISRLGARSRLKSFALTLDGQLMRNEQVVTFTGDDALAHVAAATLGPNPVTHDDTVFITHDAERCESRQVYKKVLKAGAVGVFQGKILVKEGAQKTDGYQISQALLLDDDAQFLAKPELEIYADDVVCSHGSTTGAIDLVALFYLRSRGVPKPQAIVLLVLSFLADALDEIEDEDLHAAILARLEDAMHA